MRVRIILAIASTFCLTLSSIAHAQLAVRLESAGKEKALKIIDNGKSRNPARSELLQYLESLSPSDQPFTAKVLNAPYEEALKMVRSAGENEAIEINTEGGIAEADLQKFGTSFVTYLNTSSKGEYKPNIDRKKLEELLEQRQSCAPQDSDMESLYEALSEIIADKNCSIDSMKSKELYRTRGIVIGGKKPVECEQVKVDFSSSGISGGVIDLVGDGGSTTNTLSFDANHLTAMSKEDWLNGKKAHVGLYKQLQDKGFCKTKAVSNGSASGGGGKASKAAPAVR